MTFNRWFHSNIFWDSSCYRKRGIITVAMLAGCAVHMPYAMVLAAQAQGQTYIMHSKCLLVTTDCHFDISRTAQSTLCAWHLLTAPISSDFPHRWQCKSRSLKSQEAGRDAVNGIPDNDHSWFAHNPHGAYLLPTHLSFSSLLAISWSYNFPWSMSRSLFTLAVQSLPMDWEEFQSVL